MEVFTYQGQELDVFAGASNWKRYWGSRLRKWISGDVLEPGAGIGANTVLLQNPEVRSWHCLEPDARLAARLARAVTHLPNCSVTQGMVAAVAGKSFDTILYVDVLEHIADDRGELAAAASLLRAGGRLVVLSPAHPFLFSPFDRAIGHYRRYERASMLACSPPGCPVESLFWLDAVGMLASLGNRLVLHSRHPTPGQIRFWDRYMIPVSRVLDPVLGYRLGRTMCAVWRRT